MPLCVKCNRVVCFPCVRANTGPADRPKIVVASDRDLHSKVYCRRLAIASTVLADELKLSRRQFPDWMADVIYGYEGAILWSHGGLFPISDTAIDDAFNNDGSFRWFSRFFRFAETPPYRLPQYRVLARLRLIDLAFRIDRPDTARHFGR